MLGLALLFPLAASAQEMCPTLSKLMAQPPAGFLENRGEPAGPQQWLSRQDLPASRCILWEARAKDAYDMRCTINDGAAAAAVEGFYQGASQSIDRCLAGLPDGAKYQRQAAAVDVEGLKGQETTWVMQTDAVQFKIHMTRYLRTSDSSAYNNFTVQFLHY
jgi:hypothetical protein